MMKTYKAAYALLLEKQNAYQFRQRKRKETLYKNKPELSTIDSNINHLGIALTRATIAHDLGKADAIRNKMSALEDRKKEICLGHEDLLSHSYFCPHCKDTGMIGSDICQCLNQCLSEVSFSTYDLKSRAQKETFETFNFDYYSDIPMIEGVPSPRSNAQTNKKLMQIYCQNFDSLQDQLLFTGPPGVGKTFMSNCIVNKLAEKGYGIVYVTAAHLVSSIQDQLFKEGKTSEEIFKPLILCDLLIIDDLGAEFSSEYSQKQLYEVIDSRLNADKKMIISSNLTVIKIQEIYDERLSSRICGNFKTIAFHGEDIRILKVKKSR
ncbi:AAA family ATPase [Acetobacterium paludosum]|uniref:AAA family ATPase n=1 Tax=Acetobacterium paludosum TaxID=52693 RepID=A0A923HZF9_9FIRM|nr:ATP-binding protein [Acetobacterium paludosum]MBC3889945.1 AAA family ATPase [Acetobacterium paludosum]